MLSKQFVANVTTQVVERHILRDLETSFSPLVVNGMADSQMELVASESTSARRQRTFLGDRITKLNEGRDIFRSIMGSVSL